MEPLRVDFTKLTEILREIEKNPSRRIEDPTYFEITGYPSLENVASNILGFFLDPSEAHGFGTLFLESLLSAIHADFLIDDFVDVEVEREAYTDKNFRIDIVVNTNSKVIGIENKIYAKLTNDLSHYYSYLSNQASRRSVIGVVLSLSPEKILTDKNGFVNLTYETYFDELLRNTGLKLLDHNERYFSLFLEFVKTIRNLKRDYPMSKFEFVEWLKNNQIGGDTLLQEIARFKKELTSKAKQLRNKLELPKSDNKFKITQWIWDAFHYGDKIIAMDLVHDIEIAGLKISIDTMIRASGYSIEIWERKDKIQELKSYLKKRNITVKILEDETILFGKIIPYESSLDEVRDQLQTLINKII